MLNTCIVNSCAIALFCIADINIFAGLKFRVMIQSEIKVRVRYSETDKMGFVYNGNYAHYYEIARTELMRSIGLSYKSIEEKGILMPVISLNIKFIKPSFYDDLLLIHAKVTDKPSCRIRFDYEIYNEKGELVNTGDTTLVYIDNITYKPKRPPLEIMEIFNKYF